MGEFDSDLVPHEEAFVVLGDALLSGLPALEFYETITKSIDEGWGISWRALGRFGGHTLTQRQELPQFYQSSSLGPLFECAQGDHQYRPCSAEETRQEA